MERIPDETGIAGLRSHFGRHKVGGAISLAWSAAWYWIANFGIPAVIPSAAVIVSWFNQPYGRFAALALSVVGVWFYWIALPGFERVRLGRRVLSECRRLEIIAASVGMPIESTLPLPSMLSAGRVVIKIREMGGFAFDPLIEHVVDTAKAGDLQTQRTAAAYGDMNSARPEVQVLFHVRERILLSRGLTGVECNPNKKDSIRNACLTISEELRRAHRLPPHGATIPKAAEHPTRKSAIGAAKAAQEAARSAERSPFQIMPPISEAPPGPHDSSRSSRPGR